MAAMGLARSPDCEYRHRASHRWPGQRPPRRRRSDAASQAERAARTAPHSCPEAPTSQRGVISWRSWSLGRLPCRFNAHTREHPHRSVPHTRRSAAILTTLNNLELVDMQVAPESSVSASHWLAFPEQPHRQHQHVIKVERVARSHLRLILAKYGSDHVTLGLRHARMLCVRWRPIPVARGLRCARFRRDSHERVRRRVAEMGRSYPKKGLRCWPDRSDGLSYLISRSKQLSDLTE